MGCTSLPDNLLCGLPRPFGLHATCAGGAGAVCGGVQGARVQQGPPGALRQTCAAPLGFAAPPKSGPHCHCPKNRVCYQLDCYQPDCCHRNTPCACAAVHTDALLEEPLPFQPSSRKHRSVAQVQGRALARIMQRASSQADCGMPGRCRERVPERAFWSAVTSNPPLYGADTPTSFFDPRLPFGWNLRDLQVPMRRGRLCPCHPSWGVFCFRLGCARSHFYVGHCTV